MTPALADGAGTPIDTGVSTFLFVGALLLGWLCVWRLRRRAFLGLPIAAAWASGVVAAACIVLAFVLPPIIRPDVAHRPSTTARVVILSPRDDAVYSGHPARIRVRVRIAGGRVVSLVSTHLVPNEGHIHLYIAKGRGPFELISMTFTTTHVIRVPPGRYRLQAEFVAVDHGPFDPRVRTTVSFEVHR